VDRIELRARVRNVLERRRILRELEQARDAAQAASRAKSAFVATMSHEIRTPMNGVVGIVEILRHTSLQPDQAELVDIISESATSLLAVIDDILDFSRIEAGKLALELGPMPLARTVGSACEALRPLAQRAGGEIAVSLDPGLPDWIRGDAARLRQILNNLVGNALKFSSGEGRVARVAVSVRRDAEGRLRLAVADNGIGMASEVLEKLFRPFTQAESSTTRRYGGSGLGLSISRRLAQLLGGEILVESTPGKGSTFTVVLPLEMAEAPVVDEAHSEPEHGAGAAAGAILVAEDNQINQAVIRRQLALLGYEAEIAPDGRAALERWRAGRHALVFTDLHMPGMDGYELAAAIRAEQGAVARPFIVALTANAVKGEDARCRAAGMDDYLTKPLKLERLRSMLEKWLG